MGDVRFTDSEFRQMCLLSDGYTPAQIMDTMEVSYKSVKNRNSAIRAKLGMTGSHYGNYLAAVRRAVEGTNATS